MRKVLIVLAAMLVTVAIRAETLGRYNVSVNGVTSLLADEASTVWVYNASTSTIYVAFGGHISASTNDPKTYFAYRMPVRAGASYVSDGRFSFVSIYCVTNGLVDVGFEGRE